MPAVVVVPVVVMMTVPMAPRIHDHSTARTAVRTAPVSRIVMPPAGNAVHLVNNRQTFGCAQQAGRRADGDRLGTLGERTRNQQCGDGRNAQKQFAHRSTFLRVLVMYRP